MTTTYDGNGQGFLDWIAERKGVQLSRKDEIASFYGAAPASGSIKFAANPANNDTVTVSTTAVSMVTTPASGKVTIGADRETTLAALATFLNASADTELVKCSYWASADRLYVRSKASADSTSTLALASSSANGVVSAALLKGGQSAAPAGLPRYATWAAAIKAQLTAIVPA